MCRKQAAVLLVLLSVLFLFSGPEKVFTQTDSAEPMSGVGTQTLSETRDTEGQVSPDSVHGRAAVNPELLQLHSQGKLTVRALGAYGQLPDGFMSTARELRSQDLDLLAADRPTISQWLEQAERKVLRLTTEQRQTLQTLLATMTLNGAESPYRQKPGPVQSSPAQWTGKFPPLPEPVPLRLSSDTDLRSLGAERYAGMVSLAKEAVAELLGVMDAAQQQVFDELWQPMYAFPAPECIAYLEKVIPLVEQALSLRSAVIEGTKQTSELWHAAAIAAQYDEQAASSIFQRVRLQTASLQGHKETLNALLDNLQGLGQPPDPNALQKAAQDRHERAMRTLESLVQGSVGLEGYYEKLSGLEYRQGVKDEPYYQAEHHTPLMQTRAIKPLQGSRSRLVLFSEYFYQERRKDESLLSGMLDDLDLGGNWRVWYAEPTDEGWARYEYDPEESDQWIDAFFYTPSHDRLIVDHYSIYQGEVEAERQIFHRAPLDPAVQLYEQGETKESIQAKLQEHRNDIKAMEEEFHQAKAAFFRQLKSGRELPALGNPDELYWVLLDVSTESLPEPSNREKRERTAIDFTYQDLQSFAAGPNSLASTWTDVSVTWQAESSPQIPASSSEGNYIPNPFAEEETEMSWEAKEERIVRSSAVHWEPPPALLADGAFWEVNPTLEGTRARFSVQAMVSRVQTMFSGAEDDYQHLHISLVPKGSILATPSGILILEHPIYADVQPDPKDEEKWDKKVFTSQNGTEGTTYPMAVSLRSQRIQRPEYQFSVHGTAPVGYVQTTYTYGQRLMDAREAADLSKALEGSMVSASLSDVEEKTREGSAQAVQQEEALAEMQELDRERRAFHQANIAYAQRNAKRLEGELDDLGKHLKADPGDEEAIERYNQLQFQLITERSNVVSEQDRIQELETGVVTHTRTPFDQMARTQMIRKCEESARTLSAGIRARNLSTYLMNKLSPEQRSKALGILDNMQAEGKGLYAEDFADLNQAMQNLFQGEQEFEQARIAEDVAWENAFVQGAEYVKTGADIGLTVTSLFGGPALVNVAYHTASGTIEKDIWEGAKRGVKIYSDAADILISSYDGWQSGGVWGAVEEASWSTLLNLGPRAAMNRLQFSRGFDGGYRPVGPDGSRISAQQRSEQVRDMIRGDQFKQEMEWGETLARDYFHDYSQLRTAQIQGDMPADQFRQLEMQVRQKASAVSHSMPAKSFLKYKAPPRMGAAHAEIHGAIIDDAISSFQLEMRQLGYSEHSLQQLRNASSLDMGMDTDIALKESLGMQITRNGQPVSIEEYQRAASRVMADNYKHVSGYDARSSFVELTTSVHLESYQNLEFLKLPKAGPHADLRKVHRIQDRIFGGLDPKDITQDLNISPTKAEIMFREHRELRPLGSLMETSRGTAKDLETKFIPLVESKIRQIQTVPAGQRTPDMELNLRELENTSRQLKDCHRVMQDIGQGRTHPARWVQDFRRVTGGEDPIAVSRRMAKMTQMAADM
ncbi:MAG: hypothetical protein LC660_10820 [Desulfobacteraceae bacterium]|nr:hypothetical protein [Desulfobacteraceae bacterium]